MKSCNYSGCSYEVIDGYVSTTWGSLSYSSDHPHTGTRKCTTKSGYSATQTESYPVTYTYSTSLLHTSNGHQRYKNCQYSNCDCYVTDGYESYLASCTTCNPPHTHNFSGTAYGPHVAGAGHLYYRTCGCGVRELTGVVGSSPNCAHNTGYYHQYFHENDAGNTALQDMQTVSVTFCLSNSRRFYAPSFSGYAFDHSVVTDKTGTGQQSSASDRLVSIDENTLRGHVRFQYDRYIPVTAILITQGDMMLEQGEVVHLSYTIFPSNATNKKVIWTSSNTDVAEVGPDGVLLAGNTGGIAYITATTEDGGKSSTRMVAVSYERVYKFTVSHYFDHGFTIRYDHTMRWADYIKSHHEFVAPILKEYLNVMIHPTYRADSIISFAQLCNRDSIYGICTHEDPEINLEHRIRQINNEKFIENLLNYTDQGEFNVLWSGYMMYASPLDSSTDPAGAQSDTIHKTIIIPPCKELTFGEPYFQNRDRDTVDNYLRFSLLHEYGHLLGIKYEHYCLDIIARMGGKKCENILCWECYPERSDDFMCVMYFTKPIMYIKIGIFAAIA